MHGARDSMQLAALSLHVLTGRCWNPAPGGDKKFLLGQYYRCPHSPAQKGLAKTCQICIFGLCSELLVPDACVTWLAPSQTGFKS
eukprot:276949-Pelagomonas_calceolata.AAC.1